MKNKQILLLFLLMGMICILLVACGKSDEALRVDELITNIGEVTLESGLKITAAENAVLALNEADYRQLDQIRLLEAARATYDKLVAADTARKQ